MIQVAISKEKDAIYFRIDMKGKSNAFYLPIFDGFNFSLNWKDEETGLDWDLDMEIDKQNPFVLNCDYNSANDSVDAKKYAIRLTPDEFYKFDELEY